MAILQALFALISKSAGKILNAIFGWAVRALFGRTSAKERTFLSGLVAAAAAWPLLFFGLVAPKLAAAMLAFVPIPSWVPSWAVRLVWLGLVALVPFAVGLAMAAKAPAHVPRKSFLRRLVSGFPITVGLALAFLIMFITVPVMRLWSLLRGEQSADVPLITETAGYHKMAQLSVSVLNGNGFRLSPAPPGWWVAAPSRVLRFFGGDSFASFVPQRLEHFETEGLAVSFYPSGVLLRGKGAKLTWAHGLIAEATAKGEGFQSSAPAAQDLEKQLRRLWSIYDNEPEAHRNSARLLGRLDEIARELATLDVEFDDWQVIYRQLLQLERGLRGQRQLLEQKATSPAAHVPGATASTINGNGSDGTKKTVAARGRDAREVTVANRNEQADNIRNASGAPAIKPLTAQAGAPPEGRLQHQIVAQAEPSVTVGRRARELSSVELVKEITTEVAHLAQKQIELAKTELKADLKAEATMVGGLGVAALAALTTVNLLLVTAVLALAQRMPGWAAGLMVSGFTLAMAGIIGLVAWNKRVRSPLARTRRTVKEDVQWTKERLV